MKIKEQPLTNIPLNLCVSSSYGRYPKISDTKNFNMIISDGWLVPYAGYQKKTILNTYGVGRGSFSSAKYGHLIVVVGNGVYALDNGLSHSLIGELETYTGDVFITESALTQIAICDKKNIYVFDYSDSSFVKVTTDFVPGHISYQDSYFIASIPGGNTWRLSDFNDATLWPADSGNVGAFQTKADSVQACIPIPGKSHQLLVIGSIVTQHWTNVGNQLFPYQQSSAFNIDYGCVNPATIAESDSFIVWLGKNQKSGITIMYTNGGQIQQVSTDGINYQLSTLTAPENCYAFLFKQDGHLFYQITWNIDNLSLTYDFNTGKFFNLCNKNMGCHIAKKAEFFNNKYYFISYVDGCLYELSSLYTTYDGAEIPRIIVTETVRLPDNSAFVGNNLTFLIEDGVSNEDHCVDLSVSRNGGETFSNSARMIMQPQGKRKNRAIFWGLGRANELTCQFRFWGFDRFVVNNAMLNIYQ